MGIDLMAYRVRIGTYMLCYRTCTRQRKYGKYKRTHFSTDIHLRSFVVNVFFLLCFIALYGVAWGNKLCIDNFARPDISICDSVNMSSTSRSTSSDCMQFIYGAYYAYGKRLLILAADIELNPGPGSDVTDKNTQAILDAIRETRNEISEVKNEVRGVKSEIILMKSELNLMRKKVDEVEANQKEIDGRMRIIEEKVDVLRYDQEVLSGDMEAVSYGEDKRDSCLRNIEKQLLISESERLKSSMRIFGLKEKESDDYSLKKLCEDEVLKEADTTEAKFDSNTLVKAKRVGVVDTNQGNDRMVIVQFANSHDKFRLFKFRDKLRIKGIRISNDLSFLQRQELKQAKLKGLNGYFKGNKLVTYAKVNPGSEPRPRVFRGSTRQSDNHTADSLIEESMEATPSITENGGSPFRK